MLQWPSELELLTVEQLDAMYNECLAGGEPEPSCFVIEKIEVTKEDTEIMKQNVRKPGETLTAWADRLRTTVIKSPQATDAE